MQVSKELLEKAYEAKSAEEILEIAKADVIIQCKAVLQEWLHIVRQEHLTMTHTDKYILRNKLHCDKAICSVFVILI